MTRPARAVLHASALRHNLDRVRAAVPHSRVMAVVKADGYGHGLAETVAALAAADAFAVASVEEGLRVRAAGATGPVVVLEGPFAADDLALARRERLDLVVHSPEQLQLLEQAGPGRGIGVWIKLDTGMHRLGFEPEAAAAVHRRLDRCPAVTAIGWLSHLACADTADAGPTRAQLETFHGALGGLPGPRSLANSAAVLRHPATHLDWVRPGIMLYGVSPFPDSTGPELGLQPAMGLHTRLIAVHRLPQGAAVGYGGAWVCPEPMPVGVAAIGYGDGYPRHAPSGTPVLVGDRPAALVGRVSMDMICLDLRQAPAARVGDEVTLWGGALPVEVLARHAGTIGYELLCSVTARVAREKA